MIGNKKEIRPTEWRVEGEEVKIAYSDGDVVSVSKTDFNRAFGTIITCTKEECIRDFSI